MILLIQLQQYSKLKLIKKTGIDSKFHKHISKKNQKSIKTTLLPDIT